MKILLDVSHPHNFYLHSLVETGLIGFFVLVSMYFFIIFKTTQIINFSKNKKSNYMLLNYYILVSILINFFPFLPSGSLFNNWLCIICFLPIGFYKFLNTK